METSRMPVIMHKKTIAAVETSSFEDANFGNVVWKTLISNPTTSTDSMCVGIATCPSNGSLELHEHAQAEIYCVLDGSGEVEINGERHHVAEGSVLWIPGDVVHGVFCGPNETLRWLYVFPEGRFSDIIYRFQPKLK